VAVAITLKDPQAVLDYLNSITLPAVWDVIDQGARFTIISDNAGVFTVQTVFTTEQVVTALDGLVGTLIRVVPKAEGGLFTFVSVDIPIGGTNNYLMKITSDAKQLEDFLNTAITLLFIIEHGTKKLVIYS